MEPEVLELGREAREHRRARRLGLGVGFSLLLGFLLLAGPPAATPVSDGGGTSVGDTVATPLKHECRHGDDDGSREARPDR